MVQFIWRLIVCSVMCAVVDASTAPTLFLDAKCCEGPLPKRFRTCLDRMRFVWWRAPSTEGLEALRISGSAQFSEEGLQRILRKLAQPSVVVVDLRREPHGFIDGVPVSWQTGGRTLQQIRQDEETQWARLLQEGRAQVWHNGRPLQMAGIARAISEETLCHAYNVAYVRLPIDDHLPPQKEEVDRLVQWLKKQPQSAWVHFHCAAGAGRTTTCMSMVDMVHNAKRIRLEQIIARQHRLGGIFLFSSSRDRTKRALHKQERQEFLKRFYQYCQESDEAFSVSWSEWLAQRGGEDQGEKKTLSLSQKVCLRGEL